jgi:hypothetical protein
MPIKSFNPSQQFLIIPQTDQNLRLIPNGLLQDREGTLRDFIFFKFTNLAFVQFRFWYVCVLTTMSAWLGVNALEGLGAYLIVT